MNRDFSIAPLSECAVQPRLAKALIAVTVILVNAAFFASGEVLMLIQGSMFVLMGMFVRALYGSFAALGESFLGAMPEQK